MVSEMIPLERNFCGSEDIDIVIGIAIATMPAASYSACCPTLTQSNPHTTHKQTHTHVTNIGGVYSEIELAKMMKKRGRQKRERERENIFVSQKCCLLFFF